MTAGLVGDEDEAMPSEHDDAKHFGRAKITEICAERKMAHVATRPKRNTRGVQYHQGTDAHWVFAPGWAYPYNAKKATMSLSADRPSLCRPDKLYFMFIRTDYQVYPTT